MSDRLSQIRLEKVIPDVFTSDDVVESQIWLQHFCFERGKRYIVEAASGSGKSSLCSFIYHNRSDYRGRIFYDNRDARSLSPDDVSRLRCQHIALLPQELRLFGELSALDNVKLKNNLTSSFTDDEILRMFERLGIGDKTRQLASRLSIGQMQRVALIRALCQPFDFLLLDEPVSHLDEKNNKIAAELVNEIATAYGAAVIVTSVGNRMYMPGNDIVHIKL